MKVLLTAINSKYIHSNLAVRYIKAYGKHHYGFDFDIAEFTINQRLDYILRKIANQKPDVLAISCYIWNIDMALSLACEVKKILPYCKVILGGPEVSFNSKEIMRDNRFVNFIISGEGEKAFSELILAIRDTLSLTDVPNLTYQKDGEVLENPPAPLLSLDDVPFPYEDLSALSNQILYYETSRGCPFACKYCLSSVTRSVRFLSKERW
ncbi:MAG: cobalamin-dependent protein, partial [Oscillospiraceae bacterium]|nr:cobalamin-dependent protein [Oscillospiraceae bacterium]